MICLSFTVLVTNYLFGTGSRWIVFLLAGGSALAAVLVTRADGHTSATAWADLVVQALLALAMGVAFLGHPRPSPRPALVAPVGLAAGGRAPLTRARPARSGTRVARPGSGTLRRCRGRGECRGCACR